MDSWDGHGGDPAEDSYDGDWPQDNPGYNDQFSLDDPHGPRDPRTPVPDTEEYWYEHDYQDEDNYTTAGVLAPSATSFPDSGGHAPSATSHPKSEKPRDKKSHGKEVRRNDRRDDGRGNQKNKRQAADKRPSEKKGAKQEPTGKHPAGKKGKKPATADEVKQMEEENLSFGDPGNDAGISYGDEGYGLSNLNPIYEDDPAAMAQGITNSMNMLNMNAQPLHGESSASGGTYAYADEMDQYQPDPAVSQYGSQKSPTSKSSHTKQNYDVGIQKSHEWKFGHMLYIWWTEPKGTQVSTWTTKQKARDNSWEGWRRFMIISQKNKRGNSKCVPVTTYGGQGTTIGKKPQYHGIVYDSKKTPVFAPEEPELGFRSIAVDMLDEYDTLHEFSRINYNKIQTIEHNLECRFIGKVNKADLDQFTTNAQLALEC